MRAGGGKGLIRGRLAASMGLLVPLVFMIIALAASPAHAKTRVQADSMEASGGRFTLKGNVSIEREGMTLHADNATFNEASGMVSAIGNITVTAEQMDARAGRADFNINNSVGILYDAEVTVGDKGYRISSSEVMLDGRDHIRLKDASVTTCSGIPAAWCIRGSEIDVLVGERIRAKHATIRIRDVPVFYTPYLWAPIVDKRRTGLLTPELGYRSETGAYIRQPFFWAISGTSDATLSLDYHRDRAFGQDLEYRYLTGPRTGGSINMRHIRDYTLAQDYGHVRAVHDGRTRSVSAGIDIDVVNRKDYFRKWNERVSSSAARYLDSRVELWHDFDDHSRLYVDGMYKMDLKNSTDNDTVLQRAGGVGLNMSPKYLGAGFTAHGKLRAVNYDRKLGYGGQRTSARAGLMHAIQGRPNLTQSAGFEAVDYALTNSTPYGESMGTGYLTYTARAEFRADAYIGDSLVLHSVEHTLKYSYLRMSGDDPLPFDSSELRADHSVAAFVLTHRLQGPQGEFLKFRLRQPADLEVARDKLLPLQADLSAGGQRRKLGVRASGEYDYYLSGLQSAYAGISVQTSPFSLEAGQSYDRAGPVETYVLDALYRVNGRWSLGAGARYDDKEEQGFEEKSGSLEYRSQCWSLKLAYVERPEDYSVTVSAGLLGLGSAY